MLGFGTAAFGTGFVILSDPDFDLFEDDLTGVAILVVGGGLLYLSSIPVFISASRNKKRGMDALTYIKIQEIPHGPGNSPMHTVIPAVAVKVRF